MKISHRKTNRTTLSAALFLCLTLGVYCALINPAFYRMASCLYGSKSDNFAVTWHVWALGQVNGEAGSTSLLNFPFGRSLRANPMDFLTTLPSTWLASVTNEVFAFNFVLFISFLLSGVFTYTLVYLLTKRTFPSIVCGLAYMILPYHLAMSQYHFTLARIELFPLFLLTLAWFLKYPRRYNASWILLAQFVSFAVNAHYGLFNCSVLTAFLLVYLFYRGEKDWGRPTLARIGGVLSVVVLAVATGIPCFLSTFQKSAKIASGRPLEQLYAYSARVWDYFLPPIQHPLLGGFTQGFIMSHIHDSYWHEQTLYLGWTVLGLATIGTWYLWRSRAKEHRFLGVFLPLMAIGGFLFSMPPTVNVFGAQIPMPGFFLHYLFPVFRVYARFGVVVATATVVLAGFGIAWVLERVRWKKIVGVLIAGLILFEFINVPPAHFVDLSKPPQIYQWLSEQDEVQAIAEYPLNWPAVKDGEHLNLWDLYEYMLWQRVHEKPMFNGEPEVGLDRAMKLELSDPGHPNTPARLGWLGITHVIVHLEDLSLDRIASVRRHPNLELVYADEETEVYRIASSAITVVPQEFKFLAETTVSNSTDQLERILIEVATDDSASPEEKQLAVYGPCMALYQGIYEAAVFLSTQGEGMETMIVRVTADFGAVIVAELDVDPNIGDLHTLRFETDGATGFEFRIYLPPGDYHFEGVILRRLEDLPA